MLYLALYASRYFLDTWYAKNCDANRSAWDNQHSKSSMLDLALSASRYFLGIRKTAMRTVLLVTPNILKVDAGPALSNMPDPTVMYVYARPY